MSYKRIGDFIELVDERNRDLSVTTLLGLSISKQFIPSVANTIGTNMKTYKIIRKNQFACSVMQVRRDGKMPVALLKEFDEAIISQAYPVFQVIDETKLLPDYLMMWFTRSEFDRQATFHAVGGVRGSLEWEDFLDFELPIPTLEKQHQLVAEYNTVTNRIHLNNQLNQKLEATAQALYKHWFVDFEFPVEFSSSGGVPEGGGGKKRNTKNYLNLPYNPKLKDRAKALRKASNLAEVLFWKQVKNKQFLGLDFDRQKIIGNYIVDFYCANTQTVIEIDGNSHDNKQEYDATRDAYLKSLGLLVIHITDTEIKKQLEPTLRWLKEHKAFLPQRMVEVNAKKPPRLSGTPPKEGNVLGYKSSGGEMVFNEELEKDIPVGWSVEKVSYFIEIKYGKDYKHLSEGNIPLYGSGGIMKYVNDILYDKPSVLIPRKGSLQNILLVDEPFWSVDTMFYSKIKETYCRYYIYYFLCGIDFYALNHGAAVPSTTSELLNNLQLINSKGEELKKFNSRVELLFKRIRENTKQSQTLQKLQSLLLAKMTQVVPKAELV